MTLSQTLSGEIEAYASRMREANPLFNRAKRGELTPEAALAYVSNLHLLVQHTPKNLRLAHRRALELGRTGLARYFAQKAGEEKGHDVWAERDMANLNSMFGLNPADRPTKAIPALLDYLRDLIEKEPVDFLAYILFTEYLTVLMGPEWLALLEARCGIPASTMTVVGNHVELDKDHVAGGLSEIDDIVDGERHFDSLLRALWTSMRYFDAFCAEISQRVH
jgi:hypothetical protein